MSSTVNLPVWLAILVIALAAWAVVGRLVLPGARWILRRRVNRVLEQVEARLKIRIPPFKLTKRDVLIERLLDDPQVQEGAQAEERETGVSPSVVRRRIETYAREIVPQFNAYLYFRIGYALARWVGRSLYRVRLGYSDEAGLAAIDPNATVVFLINHRSNMDYVLVSYLAAEKAALS
ncbi:MAG: glycerol-3-phosphate acyltransferase, partial [Acidobacteriota bacterium]